MEFSIKNIVQLSVKTSPKSLKYRTKLDLRTTWSVLSILSVCINFKRIIILWVLSELKIILETVQFHMYICKIVSRITVWRLPCRNNPDGICRSQLCDGRDHRRYPYHRNASCACQYGHVRGTHDHATFWSSSCWQSSCVTNFIT